MRPARGRRSWGCATFDTRASTPQLGAKRALLDDEYEDWDAGRSRKTISVPAGLKSVLASTAQWRTAKLHELEVQAEQHSLSIACQHLAVDQDRAVDDHSVLHPSIDFYVIGSAAEPTSIDFDDEDHAVLQCCKVLGDDDDDAPAFLEALLLQPFLEAFLDAP